jgi:hypothetical protein
MTNVIFTPLRDQHGRPQDFQKHPVASRPEAKREFGHSTQWIDDLIAADELVLAALNPRTPFSDVAVLIKLANTHIKPLASKDGKLAIFNLFELECIIRCIPMKNPVKLENTFRRFKGQPELIYASMP